MKDSSRRLSRVCALTLVQLGCGPGEGSLDWLWSLGGSLLLGSLMWTLLFGALGLLACLPCYWVVRHFAGANAQGPVAQIARMSTLAVMLFVFPFAFAYAGFFEGVLRVTTYQLREGSAVREYSPLIGGVGADFVGTVYLLAEQDWLGATEPLDSTALTLAFQNGDKAIDSSRIPEVFAHVEGEMVDKIAREVKREAEESLPILRDGTGKGILDWFIDNCAKALSSQDDGLGSATKLFRRFVERLPEAARREGDSTLLSHAELSAFIVESTLAEGLLKFVVRPLCRGQQVLALLPILFVVAFPIVACRAAKLIARRGAARSPDPGPPA